MSLTALGQNLNLRHNGSQAKDACGEREERQERVGARGGAQVAGQRRRGRQVPRGAVAPRPLHLRRLRLSHFPNHPEYSNGLRNENDANSTNSRPFIFSSSHSSMKLKLSRLLPSSLSVPVNVLQLKNIVWDECQQLFGL